VPGKTVFRKHEKNRIDRNMIKPAEKVLDSDNKQAYIRIHKI